MSTGLQNDSQIVKTCYNHLYTSEVVTRLTLTYHYYYYWCSIPRLVTLLVPTAHGHTSRLQHSILMPMAVDQLSLPPASSELSINFTC